MFHDHNQQGKHAVAGCISKFGLRSRSLMHKQAGGDSKYTVTGEGLLRMLASVGAAAAAAARRRLDFPLGCRRSRPDSDARGGDFRVGPGGPGEGK